MLHDRLRATLKRLHIDGSNYKVLKLLPLVYVAWCSGSISSARIERLVDLAHNHFAIGEAGERILRGWIRERPTREYFMEGLRDVLLLARAPDEWQFELTELPGLLAYSEAIARTTAEAMDAPTAVTLGEEEALAEIARELDVDDGESWAALLRELQAPGPPATVPETHSPDVSSLSDPNRRSSSGIRVFDLEAEAQGLATSKPVRRGRTMARLETLRLTLMSLKAGTIVARHKTDHEISIQTVSGRVVLHTARDQVDLPTGRVAVLQRDTPHDIEADGDSAVLITVCV
jgi:quercetin dioxygenase-like cupin family protein